MQNSNNSSETTITTPSTIQTGPNMLIQRVLWVTFLLVLVGYFFILVQKFGPPPVKTSGMISANAGVNFFVDQYRQVAIFLGIGVVIFLVAALIPGRRKFPLFVIKMVLFETIALLGFVLVMIHHKIDQFYPFVGLAVLGMLLTFPRNK